MAEQFTEITAPLREFIGDQKVFFVGTAAPDGRVNVSPKGRDTLRVLGPNRVVWLNLTGSGNETAAHLLESDRMTLMFCAFEGDPMILRLYGHARLLHPGDEAWAEALAFFPALPGPRQIIDMAVDLVLTSCGFAVPQYDFVSERDLLGKWAIKQGPKRLADYRRKHNSASLDGKPTDIPAE